MRVAIGTYVPGNSIIHRADPRTKIIGAFALAVVLFWLSHPLPIALLLAVSLLAFAIARIPAKILVIVLKPVIIISLFTLAINSITFSGAIGVSAAGFARGAFFVMRLITVMTVTSLVTLTTSPVELTDGFSSLMRPLIRFKVPVEDIAMMMSIGLRFVPTIAEELDRIVTAQRMRGAQFDEGSLFARLKAWGPVLIPLFVGMFRRADSLAMAMEARCYTGEGRTHLHELKMKTGDYAALALVLVCCVALIVGEKLWL